MIKKRLGLTEGNKMNETIAIEEIIHRAFHQIADETGLDIDLIAQIIARYDTLVAPYLEHSLQNTIEFISLN